MSFESSPPTNEGEKFVLETDQAPEFWQFLNGLRGDDLLVELIVNELDARSPRTEIRFDPDRLVCVGTGNPIDDEGWARLRKIKGAGHDVKAKVALFGVKNHGLKACFTLGNDILVRSAGKQVLQTLFADGPSLPPFPGVRMPPREDPDAPATGTQIEVTYRRKPFSVPHGEAFDFAEVTDDAIAARFQEAVDTLPKRLIGIVRQGVLDHYTLSLSHHRLGSRTFEFASGRIRREKNLHTFFRECRELTPSGKEVLEREQAVFALWSPTELEGKPIFFQSEGYRVGGKQLFDRPGLVIEAAWGVDLSGRLKIDEGRLRYPVAYPGRADGTLTGMGVHYSGPFVSDTERHELAPQSGEWNGALIGACDEILGNALAGFLLPRHRTKALELIASLPAEPRLKAFAERGLKARALPTIDHQGSPAQPKHGARLVVPAYVALQDRWSEELAKVAPPGSAILDPRTPPTIVKLLASGDCAGWNENHLRFDEKDVLERLGAVEAEHFPWRNEAEWRRTLGRPEIAKAHLDAIRPFLSEQSTAERPTGSDAYLPDGDGLLHPLSALKRGVSIPAVIGLDVPPVIHTELRNHPTLKLEGWRLGGYSFRDLVSEGGLEAKPASVRKRFFIWLAKNANELARDDWPAVKALEIWPAIDGSVYRFDQLCLPEPKLAALLGRHIAKPTREVRSLCAGTHAKRPQLTLRDEPTPDEIAACYRANIERFPTDRALTPEECSRFHAFENSLAALSDSKRAVRALRSIYEEAIALNRDGMLRPTTLLVRETSEITRLHLQAKDLLDRPVLKLDALLPPARKPSARMALDALRDDTGNTISLLPRLAAITKDRDILLATELRQLSCIPVQGRLLAPDQLAFKGNQGDFWGGWKTIISGAGLSDDAQDLYRAAGVIKSFPTPETSRAYFAWLRSEPSSAIAHHLDCIVRHIAHKQGVQSWLLQPPELPCIPVEDAAGVALLTLSEARKSAVVDDIPELADAIRSDAPSQRLKLAIHSVRSSTHPIGDELRGWGIPTLSSVAKGPTNPSGNNVTHASGEIIETVRTLAGSAAGKRFRKQLQESDIPQSFIEPMFQKRLVAIKRVVVAGDLTVQFRVRGRVYRPRRSWAVLPDEIWLDSDGDLDDLLMKAIADVVFVKPRPRYLSSVLKDAIASRARDFRPSHDDDTIGDEPGDGDDADNDDTGESTRRHPGGEPDPSRNKPKPGQLYSGGTPKNVSKGGGPQRPQVVAEDIQRRQLKAEHYAHHCQMELAHKMPEELAPAGSYVEFAENRRKIMEAHHPDKASSSGSRHAGNLLILSRINHERIGTRLSRAEITEALRNSWTPHDIKTADGETWLEGGIAATFDKVTGEPLPLFFTNEHRSYWLKMAE